MFKAKINRININYTAYQVGYLVIMFPPFCVLYRFNCFNFPFKYEYEDSFFLNESKNFK